MKPVSQGEYQLMQEKAWEWAQNLIDIQNNDPRTVSKTQRPIISLKQMLESTHEMYPDNIAFYTKFQKGPYQTITYDEFYKDVNGLGTALIKHGFKDKRIAIIGETNYTWSTAFYAIVSGVGVAVPLDKELPYDNLKNLVKEAEVSAVFADKNRLPMFEKMMAEGDTKLELVIAQQEREDREGVKSEWVLIEEGRKLVEEGDRSLIDAQIDYEEMAVLIFTSGTTGMAKGIMLSNKNFVADLMGAPAYMYVGPEEIFFSLLPIHHTYELTADFLIPIYKGAAIAHCEGLKYIVKNIQEVHPTFLLAVPAVTEALHRAIWKGIKAKGKEETVKKAIKVSNALRKVGIDITNVVFKEIKQTLGGRMRMMITGGAAINPQILDDINSFGIVALQGYGLSECAPMGALNPTTEPHSNSIGKAFPGFDAKIDNPGPDGIGEICLKGDNVMLGYYKNPEATAEVIKDGWFYTGDLGYMEEGGYIVLTGRKKNVIITKNGKNVFPEELEYQLSLFEEISESMVFEGEADNKDDDVIVAGILPDWEVIREKLGDKADDNEEVEKYLWTLVDQVNASNPAYKMIKRINLRHTEFEKNTSKKIKRFVDSNKQPN